MATSCSAERSAGEGRATAPRASAEHMSSPGLAMETARLRLRTRAAGGIGQRQHRESSGGGRKQATLATGAKTAAAHSLERRIMWRTADWCAKQQHERMAPMQPLRDRYMSLSCEWRVYNMIRWTKGDNFTWKDTCMMRIDDRQHHRHSFFGSRKWTRWPQTFGPTLCLTTGMIRRPAFAHKRTRTWQRRYVSTVKLRCPPEENSNTLERRAQQSPIYNTCCLELKEARMSCIKVNSAGQPSKKPATSASGSKATKHPDTPRTLKVITKAGGRSTSGARW